jgi:hypothetical protein
MARVRLLNGVLSDAEVNAEFASAVPVRIGPDRRLASCNEGNGWHRFRRIGQSLVAPDWRDA